MVGNRMSICQVPDCGSEQVIYSGIDAFMYGIQPETICYKCAYTHGHVQAIKEKQHALTTNQA